MMKDDFNFYNIVAKSLNHQLMGFLFLNLFGMPAPLLCMRILSREVNF